MSGIETLATLVLGGAFDATELGENDIQPDSKLIEELQQRLVTGTDDVYVELIDRAELDRVTAERDAMIFAPLYMVYLIYKGPWR